jgi:hypothetical protein
MKSEFERCREYGPRGRLAFGLFVIDLKYFQVSLGQRRSRRFLVNFMHTLQVPHESMSSIALACEFACHLDSAQTIAAECSQLNKHWTAWPNVAIH